MLNKKVLIFALAFLFNSSICNAVTYFNATLNSANSYSPKTIVNGEYKLTITGTWSGTVVLENSIDGGITWNEIKRFTSNTTYYGEETSTNIYYRFGVIAYTSGSVVGNLSSRVPGATTEGSASTTEAGTIRYCTTQELITGTSTSCVPSAAGVASLPTAAGFSSNGSTTSTTQNVSAGPLTVTGDVTASRTGTFSPAISKGPAIIDSGFAGTVSSSGATVTFTSAEDAADAGYSATNTASGLGSTLIAAAQTRYITAWTNSTTCTVDTAPSPAWSGTAITSVQLPSSSEVTSDGTLKRWTDAAGDEHFIGSVLVNTSTSQAPITVGNGAASNSSDAQVLIARDVDDTVAGNGHAFSDSSDVTRGGGIGYNSFDARINVEGTADYDHFAAFQTGPTLGTSGTIGTYYGLVDAPTISAGTLSYRIGTKIEEITGAGTVTRNYGIRVAALTKGTSTNYGMYIEGASTSNFIAGPLYLGNPSSAGQFCVGLSGYGSAYVRIKNETVAITAAAARTIAVNVPSGAMLLGVQLRVDAALADGELWDATWNDGSDLQTIVAGAAVAKNTKVNAFFNANGATPITDATTSIVITKNGGGSFTAQGTIRAVVYYWGFDAMGDAP